MRKCILDGKRSAKKKSISQSHGVTMSEYMDSTPSSVITSSHVSNRYASYNTHRSNSISFSRNCSANSGSLHANRYLITPIRMGSLAEDEVVNLTETSANGLKGISKEYVDHGDQNVICTTRHVKLWKNEAKRSSKTKDKKAYSLCCAKASVELPTPKQPVTRYKNLFLGTDSMSKHFSKNIRRYNSMFSFTSMGGKIDTSINKGKAPFVFRLSGQNYHRMGSLLPLDEKKPRFCQLYIYDTENEISNRQQVFSDKNGSSTSTTTTVDFETISYLKDMLDSENELVKTFRMARDCINENPNVDLKLRLIGKRNSDGRTYNLPTVSEVADLVVGDLCDVIDKRDIVIQTKSGFIQRLNELHPAYLPLQYPLLFPFGDDGFRIDIPRRHADLTNETSWMNYTMREYFAYRIQDRVNEFSLLLNSRRIFQQFLVDGYTMIESQRLHYIRREQKSLRCDSYSNLRNVQNDGGTSTASVGQRVILPSSFTGGARYMMQNYLDAMSLCKWFGYPDFFITITCNPKWPEVKRFLKDTSLNPEDRPDALCRVFKMKLDSFIKDLKDKHVLGKVQAVVYTVEFQKRGLPHAHICLFMQSEHRLPSVDHIDKFISVQIPDRNDDPELYELVKEFMIHGPCGVDNAKCPCMVDGKCSKNFPKQFYERTCIDPNGFTVYRRRDSGSFVEKSGVKLYNSSVVPYNKILLKRYQAHINVEWCNQVGSIKYLFKYINKGPDRTTLHVVESRKESNKEESVDEIKPFYDCRYLSACEASWRIFAYDVHYRNPSVVRLPFHLPGQQQIVYGEDEDLDDIVEKSTVACSKFESWMDCNAKYDDARLLTYVEFPTKFVWKQDKRAWEPRKKGFSIGRIHAVSPSADEAYFLRIILNKVKGPRSFDDMLTVDGVKCSSFRDACYKMGLLDDDKEYIEAIKEASVAGNRYYLRSLFATLLTSESLSRPDHVWEQTWQFLSDDILYRQRRLLKFPGLPLSEDQIKNLALLEIEKFLLGNNDTLANFSMMPFPDDDSIASSNNHLISEELSYDTQLLKAEFDNMIISLTDEQRSIFKVIIKAIDKESGGVFFVYGYGGTGKTFLWKTLSNFLRSRGDIVLSVASSGIVSLLLTGGRTAHSRFRIPLKVHEDSLCRITPNTDEDNLVRKAKLIIWDEAPMVHKHAFEALDKTLKDIMSSEKVFGGKVIVFGGDFRQILPVVPNGSRHNIVNASLSYSYIWSDYKVLKLTKNMRLSIGKEVGDVETNRFANWLLEIGEGKVGCLDDGDEELEIPNELLIADSDDPLSDLIDFVYPALLSSYNTPNYFQERAILAPKNEVVELINDRLLSLFPGEAMEYLSSDTISKTEDVQDNFDERLYSPDVLNGLKASGVPNHKLVLKVGVPVMLLRNIDQKRGLCNGTRLQVLRLGQRIIEVQIVSGSNIGYRTLLPRIRMTPSDNKIPFEFIRRQFPVSVCFAMTINKSQGQTLSKVGLYLRDPVFAHGQLYVALSRVRSKNGLKILIIDKDSKVTNKTSNVVYKEIFQCL